MPSHAKRDAGGGAFVVRFTMPAEGELPYWRGTITPIDCALSH